MFLRTLVTVACALCALAGFAPQVQAEARIIFVHHSTGRYLLQQGEVRTELAQLAGAKAAPPALWDHDYNHIGLTSPDGTPLGYDFGIPDDNTDPDGLHKLWTTANAARDSLLARFDVIAFKSCYEPTNLIRTDAQLQQYKDWYLEIRDVLDQHPEKVFVIMSPPALVAAMNDPAWAARAREFANWLGSDEFLAGHPNLRFFDLFDLLANPDDGSPTANMLRAEYERDTGVIDGHPNELANGTIGPLFAAVLLDAAAVPDAATGWGGAKALYR